MNLIEALQIKDMQITISGYQATMELGTFHEQPFGYLNGGAVLAFGEITAGQASNLLGKGQYHAVGQSVSGNHMRVMKAEGRLYAKAELLHKGKRSHVWNIRMEDERGRLISIVAVTNALVRDL